MREREVERALARLADPEAVVDRAARAVEDLDRAATFVEEVGVEELRAAVERAERRGDDDRAERGREALAAFEAYREAAGTGDHFRRGRGTDLRCGAEGSPR